MALPLGYGVRMDNTKSISFKSSAKKKKGFLN